MAKCNFCGKKIPLGRGKMFVKATGKIYWFCGSKCEKNFMLGRNPKKLKWVRKNG